MVDNLQYNENCPKLVNARYRLENLSYAITAGPRDIQEASERCVCECNLEFPRVHPRLMRKDYRYVYGVDCDEKLFW